MTASFAAVDAQLDDGDHAAAMKSLEQLRKKAYRERDAPTLQALLERSERALGLAEGRRQRRAAEHLLYAVRQNSAFVQRSAETRADSGGAKGAKHERAPLPPSAIPGLSRDEGRIAAAPAFCSNCGADLNDGARFCAACGQQLDAPKQPAAPSKPTRKSNAGQRGAAIGCGGLLAVVIVVGVAVAISSGGGHHKTPAQKAESTKQHAAAFVKGHLLDADRVSASVSDVEVAIGLAEKAPTQANVDELAQIAQEAHDTLNDVRDEFLGSDGGILGDAEDDMLLGANDLKNAMGALVAYTGNPNPETLVHFTSQYQRAKSEWNSGVQVVWRLAHRTKPPTV